VEFISPGDEFSFNRIINLMCISAKSTFVLACFQASAAPRPENSHSDEKHALFGLDTQITIESV
jgi:hypothetical protein